MKVLEKLVEELKKGPEFNVCKAILKADEDFKKILDSEELCMETYKQIESGLLESYEKFVEIADNLSGTDDFEEYDITEENLLNGFIEGALEVDKENRMVTIYAILKEELDTKQK